NFPMSEPSQRALREVAKFTQLRNKGWPKGYQLELRFQQGFASSGSAVSSSLACALLLNSLITGQEIDPLLVVTGDFNADGEVQPVGGIRAKLRAAADAKSIFAVIPAKNESYLTDMLMMDGPATFAAVQIFAVSKFDDVLPFAATEKPD